ncbi:hypothetical protein B0H10DRAFT_2231821 [Mycena sp. CBHHK59/15]|nr:hypothetical protein B0H10DRAFT_2231821 [Mycena sp. CBHHK59/15]
MSLAMPSYTAELEYTLDLGAESTPPITPLPAEDPPPRARNWRPTTHADEQRSEAQRRKRTAERARAADARDCGICDEPASGGVRTACCGALFCREHIDDWLYGPASTGLCPACAAPCVLPDTKMHPCTPPSSRAQSPAPDVADAKRRLRLLPDALRLLSVLAIALLLLLRVLARREPADADVFADDADL